MLNRHSLAMRASHWLFAAVFFVLVFTGLILFFHASRRLGWSAEHVHLLFVWPMLIVGGLYVVAGVVQGDLGELLVRASDIPKMLPMLGYYLGWRSEPPLHGKYNPLQKAAYSMVLFVLTPLIILTGYLLWPHAPFTHRLTAMLGGRASVRLLHNDVTVALLAFFVGHILMVTATGLRENLRSMLTGRLD